MNISVLTQATPCKLTSIVDLRCRVWSDELSEDAAFERFGLDQWDNDALHICVYDGTLLAATGRLIFPQSREAIPDSSSFAPAAKQIRAPLCIFNRLVTHPDYRGRRYAAGIDQLRLELAKEHGAEHVWAEARGKRIETLKRNGFTPICRSGDESVPGEWWLMRLSLS